MRCRRPLKQREAVADIFRLVPPVFSYVLLRPRGARAVIASGSGASGCSSRNHVNPGHVDRCSNRARGTALSLTSVRFMAIRKRARNPAERITPHR